jgi:anti-sigma regulatory factor (Ser/Thr protein kinase)
MNESGFARREVLDVQLAVEEACITSSFTLMRAEKASYGSIGAKKDRLWITIEDDGSPFDPTGHMTLPRTTHDDIEGPVGGWGIGLIRMLVDEITYERRPGKNILCLVKKKKYER